MNLENLKIDWNRYQYLDTKRISEMTSDEKEFYIYMQNIEEYRSGLGGDE